MKTAQQIEWATRSVLRDAASKHPEYADYLHSMHIQVSSRMTNCAGKAFYRRNLIKMSLPYFADDTNFEQDLVNTALHEAAHLIAYVQAKRIFKKIKPHGPEWRAVHKALGGNGERCHQLELSAGFSRRRITQRVMVHCSLCGNVINLGPTQAKRHTESLAKGGIGYIHKKCPK